MADENVTQTPAPDFAGYPNSDELARGYRNSSTEAKRLAAENQRLQEQLQGFAANQRPDIPNRSRPEDRLAEFGIPTDALEEFFVQRLGKAFEPLARAAQARPQVISEYPDYVTYETAVNDWVRSDPKRAAEYDNRFPGDPVGAMKLAFLEFGAEKRKTATPTPQNAQEMADASLPGGRSGETRRPENYSNAGDIAEAWKNYQKSGSRADAETYARARLKNVISEEFLRQ